MSARHDNCDCCDGLDKLTPMSTANPPGQDALVYRAGVHAAFLETMMARLTDMSLAAPQDAEAAALAMFHEARALTGLTTRDADDPAIALLDAWATVADVLTFYQERIANEGYLRTATERRSLVEMALLMGYRPRPGVASSVYLAFTIEDGYNQNLILPKGARAQSTPGPGESAQTFEVSKPLEVRAVWNNLKPRSMVVQTSVTMLPGRDPAVYLKGIATNLKPGDALLLERENARIPARVKAVLPDAEADYTKVTLQAWSGSAALSAAGRAGGAAGVGLKAAAGTAGGQNDDGQLDLNTLARPVTPQLESAAHLPRSVDRTFAAQSDMAARLLAALNPALRPGLYTAWRSQAVEPVPFTVYALRAKASPFGHNAPLKIDPIFDDGQLTGYRPPEEWPLRRVLGGAGVEQFSISFDQVYVPSPTQGSTDFYRVDATVEISTLAGRTVVLRGSLPLNPTSTANMTQVSMELTSADSDEVVIVTFTVGRPTADTDWTVTRGRAFPVSLAFKQRQVFLLVFFNSPGASGETDVRVQTSTQGEVDIWLNSVDIEVNEARFALQGEFTALGAGPTEQPNVLSLDAVYSQIIPESWVVINRPDAAGIDPPIVAQVKDVSEATRADYGITAKGTQLTLDRNWLVASDTHLSTIRATTVYAQSELLPLADVPLTEIELPLGGSVLELENLYDGLESGRWIIVSGERADLGDVSGVIGTELAMIQEVVQGTDELAGARTRRAAPAQAATHELKQSESRKPRYAPAHTTLTLARPLAYTYKIDTVTIYGNVAEATHGETRKETLGAGSGSQANQRFTLKQKPLTFTPASTPSGVESTLSVYVNDILWHEAPSPVDLLPGDREYITSIDNDGVTTVIFGDGKRGARLPTGPDNVRAVYRSGIGAAGNVRAGAIDMLATRPLGVKGVINPLPATGGADPEGRDRIRANLPLAGRALGRLISVRDYEDFARVFAGIGKASAAMVSKPPRSVVHVTVAGEGDIPISPDSKLYRSLLKALRQYGDPDLPVELAQRELRSLVIAAGVKRHPDFLWEVVSAAVRAALLEVFSFERRELGQQVVLSEVVSAIQNVPGVEWVDLDLFTLVSEADAAAAFLGESRSILTVPQDKSGETDPDVLAARSPLAARLPVYLARAGADSSGRPIVLPAQLAYLRPDVPDTLILNEILAEEAG